MKFLAAAAFVGGLMIAGAASASTLFFEGFDEYNNAGLVNGATAPGPNTAALGSNEFGNTFSTAYSFRTGTSNTGPNSMYDEGTWTIGTNPNAVHSLWVNQPQPGNPFLMLNGSTNDSVPAPTAYESGDIHVTGGTYSYSYDLLNLCCTPQSGIFPTPSQLQLFYTPDGGATTLLVLNPQAHTIAGQNGWVNVSGNFSVGAGTIRLGLRDDTSIASGNDFGVDNIRLANVPEPASWALMIMGFGAMGATLRQRRRALA